MINRRNRKRIEEVQLLPLDQPLKSIANLQQYLNPRRLEQPSSSSSLLLSLRSTQLRPTQTQRTSHIEQPRSLKLSKRNCSVDSVNPTIKEFEHLERNTLRNSDHSNSTSKRMQSFDLESPTMISTPLVSSISRLKIYKLLNSRRWRKVSGQRV